MKQLLLLLSIFAQSALFAEAPARLIQFASSPNEHWSASVTRRGEEGAFTLRLVNTASNTLTRTEHLPGNRPIGRLFPADNGALVAELPGDCFCAYDAAGNPGKEFWLRIPEAERGKYAHTLKTTGGDIPIWRSGSKRDCITLETTPYFYYRTYWGYLFAIDLSTCTQVTDPEALARLEQSIVDETRRRIACPPEELSVTTIPCDSCGEPHGNPEIIHDHFIIRQYRLPGGRALTEKQKEELAFWGWETLLEKLN